MEVQHLVNEPWRAEEEVRPKEKMRRHASVYRSIIIFDLSEPKLISQESLQESHFSIGQLYFYFCSFVRFPFSEE